MKPGLTGSANNRSYVALIGFSLLVLTIAACGPGVNAEGANVDETSTVSTPLPTESPLFEKYSFAFLGLCEAPESLNEIAADAELIDLGLLAPSDIELSMRELGISLRSFAEWAERDVQEFAPIPDPMLISDIKSKGDEILKLRLALLRGEKVTISDQILEIESLFARGKKVCDWRDENS